MSMHRQHSSAVFVFICLLIATSLSVSAQSDEEQIRAVRHASNQALKSLDESLNMTYLSDDVLITTGAGVLLSGKQSLQEYIDQLSNKAPMFWIRDTEELVVNKPRGLAWEQGVWRGYMADDLEQNTVIVHGKYAAQWKKTNGKWLIQSQLFVTLN
ncbi:YybH family protein [Aestuariibacter salexigens]|uniref:YybH family protein n=1 Tax=Aestuariibacter salexigens TaxID=226010 RepID=UPI001969B330|nr:DUF4440 domain-containing protein [Aestuariibacter salexigens]